MDLLVFSQIFFNLTASIVVIVLGVLFAITTYYLIYIMKHLQNISNSLDGATDELKMRIEEIMEKLLSLPLFSYFLKTRNKGSGESRNKKRS